MAQLRAWGGHGRRRITGRVGGSRRGNRPGTVHGLPVSAGKALVGPQVSRTQPAEGPVPLALGRPRGRQADGFVGSAARTASKTVAAYARRCDSAETGLDDPSQGVQLESARIRSAHAWERLCWVWALPPLDLVAPGTAVVTQGQRRGVDALGCVARAI